MIITLRTMMRYTELNSILRLHNLELVNISWDDLERTPFSTIGPHISDISLKSGGLLMPIIRPPNYEDITSDVKITDIPHMRVDNICNTKNQFISLSEFLHNFNKYVPSDTQSLWSSRDNTVLTRSQCCWLLESPNPDEKSTSFCISAYSYQSTDTNPTTMYVIVSNQGTSIHLGKSGINDLYFNNNGTATMFSAESLQNRRLLSGDSKSSPDKKMTQLEKANNMLMIIQIPIFQIKPHNTPYDLYEMPIYRSIDTHPSGDVQTMDYAQIHIGESKGTFNTYISNIVRNHALPISVTFQYYRIGNSISRADITNIVNQLNSIKKVAITTGSLVTSKNNRPTKPNYPNTCPPLGFI